MVFHKGARVGGGNLESEISTKIDGLLDEFLAEVQEDVQNRNIRNAMVRAMLPCAIIIIVDNDHIWVAAQKQVGMPSTLRLDSRPSELSLQEVYEAARWEFGFDEPFVIQFQLSLLEQVSAKRLPALKAIAKTLVESEYQRVQREMNIIQINPSFGPASYVVDPRLAFILMPFTDELTQIYRTLIKPTVELDEFGLVCKRADDIKSTRVIIQDIWKSVCEARVVLADLTGLNPNVMYELGIAHTVGKETILIYQQNTEIKFPFDLAHIRRIEYINDAAGGQQLIQQLKETLAYILAPSVLI
jgi:hypothetical protein